MKLTVNGNINKYYVQTLCLLFFPGSRFSESADEIEKEPRATVTVAEENGVVTAAVKLENGGREETATEKEPILGGIISDASRIAVGKAFFKAGKLLTGVEPKWGILTGVRPSKIALGMLYNGKSEKEIKESLSKELFVSPQKAELVTKIAAREKEIISKAPERSCSVYISVPFCPSRCSYCSFVSVSSKKLLSMLDDYLLHLVSDIRRCFELISRLGLKILTVYIGGGTPTTLSEKQLDTLLCAVSQMTDVESLEEFTVEAGRPDTVTREKFRVMKEYHVSRVSVNTQTLNDDILASIGRGHTSKQFYEAFEIAKNSGIAHINTDLIAGLVGESAESFSDTVNKVAALRPDNVTVHTLCIKSAADLAQNMRGKTTSGNASYGVEYARERLAECGYYPYYIYRQKNTVENLENVGYALRGAEGLYNIYMMEEIHSIFAVGAGAVSKLVSKDKSRIERIFEYKYPYEYLSDEKKSKNPQKEEKIIDFYNNIW